MFHAAVVLSEKFIKGHKGEWKGVKGDEIGHVVPCKALRACKAALPRVRCLRHV